MQNKKITVLICFAFMLGIILLQTGCSLGKKESSKIALGMQALADLDYESANQYFEAAIVAGENAKQAYRGQGMVYLAMAQYDDSIAAFERALRQSNGLVDDIEYDIAYYLAVAEYKNNDFTGAYDTYSAIIALDENNVQAYYLRGVAALKCNMYDEAISDFNKVIEIAPKDHDLSIRIYEDLVEAGYKEDGDTYLKRALESDTKMSVYQQGKFYYYLGQYEDARNSFEKASTSMDQVELLLFLGKTYEALGDMNYAASLYSDYLEDHQNEAEVYNQLGLCKLSIGEYSDALEVFEQGIALEDNTIMQSLKYNEMVTYEYLTDFKKATVLIEDYLKIYPDDEKALREYAFLKTR